MERAVTVWASVLFVTRAAARAAVVTRHANLRAGPSRSWPIKEELHPGDELLLVDAGRTDGYYEVRARDGEGGWVLAGDVQITDLARWSEDRDAPLVAYVVDVTPGSQETPRRAPWRVFMVQHDVDLTTPALKETLRGHWVRFSGA
ncbi:MAG: hypothetical protein DMD38_14675 [Gemmatimonadetes bacterium]|nr:MAG: hypothetical protein AUI86_10680 [Gemmatimonadetes bacterium 13_1_40CM_3_66_12]OLD87814.1 MAG: hypothetical protein AUG85_06280 [Gemmatimonadetes bacterium 13_1_20CM_4_66_11]PYP94772.1 MAG: hypothetical protein DMD38_14675 [Gemmatimonadota bacterium]